MLPPLELDPVGESGCGTLEWRLKEEEEDEEVGLGRKNGWWEGLKSGEISTGKVGLNGEDGMNEATSGTWSSSGAEEEEESRLRRKRRKW